LLRVIESKFRGFPPFMLQPDHPDT
jgi:hypothetical protein